MKTISLMIITLLLAITLAGSVSAATADIKVEKWTANTTDIDWVDETNATYNDDVYFITAVKNLGPETATNVVINDSLPNGLKPTNWYISLDNYQTWLTNDASYNPNTGLWTISQLNPNQRVYLNYLVKANPTFTGTYLSTGTLVDTVKRVETGTYVDPNPSNDQKTVRIHVPIADIGVTSTAPPSNLNFGDEITITINAVNNGPNTATGVQITNRLPSGLKFISSNGDYNPTTGVWNVGTLTNGATATLNILARVMGTSGTLSIVSNKTASNPYDYNPSNDISTLSRTINVGTEQSFYNSRGRTDRDDGRTNRITLPFSITLGQNTFNRIYIYVNGFISTGNDVFGEYSYKPTPSNWNYNIMAPFWDDIDLTKGGNVYYRTYTNMVTITWVNVAPWRTDITPTPQNTFQLRIVRNPSTLATTYAFIYGDMQWKVGYYGGNNGIGNSFAGFRRQINAWGTSTFWTSAGDLSQIANQTFWFDSNGNSIASPTMLAASPMLLSRSLSSSTPEISLNDGTSLNTTSSSTSDNTTNTTLWTSVMNYISVNTKKFLLNFTRK